LKEGRTATKMEGIYYCTYL